MSTKKLHAAQIIASLHRHHQRATYGAVGGAVGLPAQSVMSGLPKSRENSWVVAKASKLPTGYTREEWHPRLLAHDRVLTTADELVRWLREHG